MRRILTATAFVCLAAAPILAAEVIPNWEGSAGSNNQSSPAGFPENMAPSGVNDSAREVMAAIARLHADTDGAILTTGSANAYAMAASQTIGSYVTGHVFTFIASFGNTSTATLNVDGNGAKQITKQHDAALVSGDIEAGQIVTVAYAASTDTFQMLSQSALAATVYQTQGDVLDDFNTLGVVSSDGEIIVGTGSGAFAYESGATARTSLGLTIGTDVQTQSAALDDLDSLGVVGSDGEIIVGTGAGAFAYESGATARTSLGLTIGTDVQTQSAALDDLDTLGVVASDGEIIVGTGSGAFAYESGATARTSLGLTIGTNVQTQSAALDDLDSLGVVASDGQIIVGTGSGAFAYESGSTARTSLGAAGTADANTFTADQTLEDTDAAPGPGPLFTLHRNSASPATNDLLADLIFQGEDTDSNATNYGVIRVQIEDPSSGSEDATIILYSLVDGLTATEMTVSGGLRIGNATGSHQGTGTINATAVYDDGVLLTAGEITESFVSAAQTITNSGTLTMAHSLAAAPDILQVYLRNTTAELGYTTGEELLLGGYQNNANGGVQVRADGTNIYAVIGSDGIGILRANATTGSPTGITNGSWALIFKGWN
jgi:hypothetical protein